MKQIYRNLDGTGSARLLITSADVLVDDREGEEEDLVLDLVALVSKAALAVAEDKATVS